MNFAVAGLSYKTAPLDVREKAYIPESAVGECLQRLIDRDIIESGILLSTCNRTELYAVTSSPDGDRLRESFGLWPHQLAFDSWRRFAYQLSGDAAMAHLFRVAAGLDSMVLGEGQILGQIKQAFEHAQQVAKLDPSLHVALRGAIRAGKRVRHETELGRNAVSVSHAAVAQARNMFGGLRGRGVLLVGAGPMSEVALRLLRDQGIGETFVTSRTVERAERVALPLGARAIAWDEIDAAADAVDILLSSSSAPSYLFDVSDVQRMQNLRRLRPLLVLDIAVPRDVDPAVAQLPGVHLFNIDDLRDAADANLEGRRDAIPAAERIVAEELDRTRAALQAGAAAPTVTALLRRTQRIRDQALARHLGRVPATETRHREAMQRLAADLTARFLDGPLRLLRSSDDPMVDEAVIRDAFDLGPEADADA